MPKKKEYRKTCHMDAGTGLTRRQFLKTASMSAAALSLPVMTRASGTQVVKIGHIQSLSGPSAPYGVRARDGAVMAMKEINGKGGITDLKGNRYQIELLEADMVNDPKQAITLFRQYSFDPSIVASMGPTNSVGFLPCIPVSGQIHMPLIGNGSGAPVPDDQWTAWAYRINPVSKTATPAFLEVVIKAANVKRLAVVYDPSQDAHAGDAHICKQLAGKIGYEIVSFEACRGTDQDFSSQLTNVRVNKPDAVFVMLSTGDAVRLVTQLREMGIEAPLLTGYGALLDTVFWDGTGGQIQGGYTWASMDLTHAEGRLKRWIEQYDKTFKLSCTSYSIHGYDSVYLVADCIRQAGSNDRDAIQEVLSSMVHTSPLGNQVTFKNPPNGENLTPPLSIVKIDGRASGKVVV